MPSKCILEREVRIQKTGDGTAYVYLPKEWAENCQIKIGGVAHLLLMEGKHGRYIAVISERNYLPTSEN